MTREEMVERIESGEDPLEVSIEVWEDIKAGKGEKHGALDCGLCVGYAHIHDCKGCPLSTGSGNFCDIRPFKPWRRHSDNNHGQSVRVTEGCEECIRLLDEGIAAFKEMRK